MLLSMVLYAAVGAVLEAQTLAWGERVFGGITDWPELEMDRVLVLTSGAIAKGLEPAGTGFEGLGDCVGLPAHQEVSGAGSRSGRRDVSPFPVGGVGSAPMAKSFPAGFQSCIPGDDLVTEAVALQFATAVPEVSSALLVSVAGLLLVSSRRRRNVVISGRAHAGGAVVSGGGIGD